MKGVITAGGLGTRLLPMTRVTNKHLLPVYDRPMIFYPIESLAQAGIDDIMIITGGKHAGDFLPLLGDGRDFGLKRLHYAYQAREGGIAEALSLTRDFVGGEPVVVMLGDNIIQNNIVDSVKAFQEQERGARIILKEVEHPEHYGVARFDENKNLTGIIEKPKTPPSNLAVIGVYMYDGRAFDIIDELEPSGRGELEITDVNNAYLKAGELQYDVLEGWWADCGETRFSLHEAACLVEQTGANTIK